MAARVLYRFGDFELDAERRELRREGESVPIDPKPFALVAYLIRHRDRSVPKEELLRELWPGVVVSDAALASALRDARRALGDDGVQPRFIETRRGLGLRFIHPVEELGPAGEREVTPAFVGRVGLLETLLRQLDAARAGRGQLVLLAGEAGIGKTRTAHELASQAGQRGIHVHVGSCLEEEGAPPYHPWIQLVRDVLDGRTPASFEPSLDAGAASALARLLLDGDSHPKRNAGEASLRFALLDAVWRVLQAAAAQKPRLLVIDDLHRADPSSLLLLKHVAEELPNAPLMLLGAYRNDEIAADHPLARLLADLHPAGTRIPLTGLSTAEVAELVRVTGGHDPSPELTSVIHLRTDGNPLFVEEITRALAADGTLGGADAAAHAGRSAPEGVRQVLRQRVARLPEVTRAVLEVASVVGREFDLAVLERASRGIEPSALRAALEVASGAGLVAPVPGAVARYRFRHILMRDALYASFSASRRAALHAAVGDAIERSDPFERDAHADALAHHFEQAILAGEATRAARWTRRAAERALERAAWEEAAELCLRALRAAEFAAARDETEGGEHVAVRARAELLVLLGRARWFGGATAEAREAFRQAAEAARAIGAADVLARAALGFTGRTDITPGVNRPAVALMEEALAALPEHELALRSELVSRLGTELYYDDDPQRSDDFTRDGVALAERAGDDALLAYALSARHFALVRPEVDPATRLVLADRMVALAERSGASDVLALGLSGQFTDLLELGDGLRFEKALRAFERVAEALRQPYFRWMLSLVQGLHALLQGSVEDADRLAHEGFALGQRFGTPNAPGAFALQLIAVRREQGRLHELEAPLQQAVRAYPDIPALRPALAAIPAEIGRREEARDAVNAIFAAGLDGFPRDNNWLSALGFLATACAGAGEPELARRVYDLLAPYEGRMIVVGHGISTLGAVSHHRGTLAVVLGDHDAADEHFSAARALHRRMGARLLLAHTQREHARALWKRGTPGDREQARELQAEAVAAYERFGLAQRVREARELFPAG